MKSSIFFLACILVSPVIADEGMWPFNQFSKDAVTQKYKFEVTGDFLDNLRLASVRMAGGSGAFVSPNGLLLTNQHIVYGCLSKLSSSGRDYLKDGFYASTTAAELACPGLEASVLISIEDVTTQVKAAAKENATAAQAVEQRDTAIARLEKDCADKTGGRCSVVTLFSGGRYDLYKYKSYRDVRLVFAPEYELAFFGRERDSITYLRYGLDIAFLRAYENGKPAATPHYLKWSTDSLKEGDLVFAAGNPGPTLRLATASQLSFYRDTALPLALTRLQPRVRQVMAFAAQNEGNLRAAQPTLTLLLNGYKAAAGNLIGLRDDRLVARKKIFDGKIRQAVERDPKLGTEAGKVWDQMAAAYKTWAPFEKPYQTLEGSAAPGSDLFRIARQVVRIAAERSKPDDQRLRGYRSGALQQLEPALYSDAAINDSIEMLLLTAYLEELKNLGDKQVPVKAILGGKSPQQAAEAFVKSTKLKDVAERRRLASSLDAVRKSDDGMIQLALQLDEPARRMRKKREEVIGSLEASAAEKIAQYRFKLFGAADYPDATGTPRVEFGVVKGYVDRAGVTMPSASSFGGLYYRRNNEGPYQIPQRWVDLKPALNQSLSLDFVSTCDIGGGDYGTATVNRAGELVGVTFDGNLESLPDIYLYSDEQARAVHVAVQGISESLYKVYKATPLIQELGLRLGLGLSPEAPLQ